MTVGVAIGATGTGNQIDAGVRLVAEAAVVPAVTAAARNAGRPAPRIVALVHGVVTSDPDAARAAATEQPAFYEQIPSYARAVELSGGKRAADVAVIGDERTVAAEVQPYRDAGATEVVLSGTDLAGEADRQRTWALLGELAGESGRARTVCSGTVFVLTYIRTELESNVRHTEPRGTTS